MKIAFTYLAECQKLLTNELTNKLGPSFGTKLNTPEVSNEIKTSGIISSNK